LIKIFWFPFLKEMCPF